MARHTDVSPTQSADDAETASRNWAAFQRAYSPGHERYVELAKRCNDFFCSKQWDAATKKRLEAEGRPALTFNMVRRVVNVICGHHSNTQVDFAFKPRAKGATAVVADILTRLADNALDLNDYHDQVEPQIVSDGLIEQRGYIDVRISDEHNALGEIKITAVDPRQVILDPKAREYDPDTWTEVYIDRWMSLDEVEMHYGKEARDKAVTRALSGENLTSTAYDVDTFDGDGPMGTFTLGIDELDESRIRGVRVIERQYRTLGKQREFVDLGTGVTRPVPEHWDDERVAAVAEAHELFLRSRLARRVRWTVSTDCAILHDDWSPYGCFTIIPYFPTFRRGSPLGLVEDLLDPQEYLNKSESQTLHIINTTANSGWVVEAGSLVNMTEEELEEKGASTGLVVVYGRGRQPPSKIESNTIPTGIQTFAARANEYIGGIAGAAALLGGEANPEVSGVQMETAANNALVGLKPMFDNLKLTRKYLGRKVLRLIQNFYTEPRVYMVTDWRDPELPQEEVAINQQAADAIINDVTMGEYSLVVSSAPARDSAEDKIFAETLQLREAGVPIPAYHVVEASHLPNKRAIAAEVRQLEGLGEPSEIDLMLQELQLQRAQMELSELEAKVMELQSRAQLQGAKAQAEMGGAELEQFKALGQHERELARLRADVEKFQKNLENKLQLAELHTGTKTGLTRYNQQMNARQKGEDRNAELIKAERDNQWRALIAAAGKRDGVARSDGTVP